MSRNLCRTDCITCRGRVLLTGVPHPYEFNGRPGWVIADAECEDCGTKYSAWINAPGGSRGQPRTAYGFFDLSYRSTFNDEPGEDDVPRAKIEIFRVVMVDGQPRSVRIWDGSE